MNNILRKRAYIACGFRIELFNGPIFSFIFNFDKNNILHF